MGVAKAAVRVPGADMAKEVAAVSRPPWDPVMGVAWASDQVLDSLDALQVQDGKLTKCLGGFSGKGALRLGEERSLNRESRSQLKEH